MAGTRDWDVLSAARDLLVATGEFDGVHLSALPEGWGTSASEGTAAILRPSEWEEDDEWDDASDVEILRRVTWTLTIAVRREDEESRDAELDRISAVAADALGGVSLAGLTLPKLTRLFRGRYEDARPPERRMTIEGQFCYLVDGFGGRSTT